MHINPSAAGSAFCQTGSKRAGSHKVIEVAINTPAQTTEATCSNIQGPCQTCSGARGSGLAKRSGLYHHMLPSIQLNFPRSLGTLTAYHQLSSKPSWPPMHEGTRTKISPHVVPRCGSCQLQWHTENKPCISPAICQSSPLPPCNAYNA